MKTSILTDLHRAAGARLSGDGETLLTYGDVPGEYGAGTEAALVFDATARCAISATGAEAREFLHRILAQDVKALALGQGSRSLLLSPKGKVLADFDMVRAGEQALSLYTLPGMGADLMTKVDMYHFTEALVLEDITDSHAPLEVMGPKAAECLRSLGLPTPDGPINQVQGQWNGNPVSVMSRTIAGSAGFRLDAGPEHAAALWLALTAAGCTPGGLVVRDILRVEAGRARFGVDVDDGVYPQEARLEEAFSLDKGCYIGQEVVAKIDTYGGLNKRMVGLVLSSDDPVAPGTRLIREIDGEVRDLGVVTSWSYSFVHDTGLALAYVKRRHQALDNEFQLADTGITGRLVKLPVRPSALPVTGDWE